MRQVALDSVIRGTPVEEVFKAVSRFERYPDHAPHVESTVVHSGFPNPVGSSSWELHFRSGLLRWTEEERFLPDRLRIEFVQTDGDFDIFSGHWALLPRGNDTMLHFQVDFDFGIPSMASILDPIAERVIAESIAWMLVGTFTEVELASGANGLRLPHSVDPAPPRGTTTSTEGR